MADQYVQLIPSLDPANQTIRWTMVYQDHIGSSGSYPDIDLGNNTPTKFTYAIVDINNLGITFDPRPVPGSSPASPNALWVATGSGTQKTAGLHTTQVKANTVVLQKSNSQLKFWDTNDNYDVLTYQLNFVNPSNLNEAITPIDPEIRNGGGGGGIAAAISAQTAVILISAAVILTLAAYFVGRAAGRARNARVASAKGPE